jgi:ankyrin repeat protein
LWFLSAIGLLNSLPRIKMPEIKSWLQPRGDRLTYGPADDNRRLLEATSTGDDRQVRALLGGKVDINCRDSDGFTPLINAALKGNQEIVILLIKKGAGVNLRSNDGFTPLMAAAKYGHTATAALLVEKGADIHAEKTGDDVGWTALMFAAWQGKTDVVKLLLDRGAKVDPCTEKDHWTPLMFAIRDGQDDTARWLIEKGANVNIQDLEHFTPLMCAAKFGRLDVARLLIEHGADIHAEKIGEDAGWTALMFAAWQGKTEVAELLLERGAKVDACTEKGRSNSLLFAIQDGHDDTARLLIEKGADINHKNVFDWAPIHFAARNGDQEAVALLMNNGAHIDQRTTEGYSALGLAAFNGHLSIVQRLVEAGADVNSKDETEETPLGKANQNNHDKIVQYLLAHGARDTREEERDYTRGLRPLGNRNRLTQTTPEVSHGYDVRLLLFRDRGSAEKYYDLFVDHARVDPPPFLIEVMLLFIPETIFAEKYAVVIPNEQADTRPGYNQWAMDAIRSCNDTLRIHTSTDHMYKELHKYVDVVYKWRILVPKNFSRSSNEAKELLRDAQDEGFPPLKVVGQEGVAPPPETPKPQGPWVGILFEIASFNEALYGRAATALLLEVVGNKGLTNCVVHGGDILPECRYWCSAVHTSSNKQARSIEKAVNTSIEKHLAPAGSRLLSDSEVPIGELPFQGFISQDGVYVGV